MKQFTKSCLLGFLILTGCAKTYSLVQPGSLRVAKDSIEVSPTFAWNRAPKGPFDVAWEENWTENGPILDSIEFIGGLPDGQAITRQRPKEDRQVPVFHANMSPQDIVSMIESYYRIKARATVFETKGVQPVRFLDTQALQFDYAYVGGDEVKRRGRAVVAVINKKLYLMALDGAELHYFPTAQPAFDSMVASARLR